MSKKYVRLKVIMTVDYMVPVGDQYPDDEYTYINGWTLYGVIQDWFKDHPLSNHHATRDAYKIGNSEQLIKVIEMETIE